MQTIVFGGSGFLGSHVADALSVSGHAVTVFDRKPSAYLRSDQRMIVGDILDLDLVRESLRGADYVYNFAGIADLDDAFTQPLTTVTQNILGNVNVLEAARLNGVKRFLYASTIYVHSEMGGFYRCSKQASELYVEEYQRRYGLEYSILRYGTLYGPRSDSRNSIYRYISQALTKGKIVASGSGEELRDYIHARDAAALSVSALEPRFANAHLTLVGRQTMRFMDLLLILQEILSGKLEIELTGASNGPHYRFTPYSYCPKPGYTLLPDASIDFGQGLIECFKEVQKSLEIDNTCEVRIPTALSHKAARP